MPKKIADIIRKHYAMKFGEEDTAEITMYGEIVESQPVDYWTGELVEGEYIIQGEFMKDLEAVINTGIKSLTIRMSSIGGDADVAVLIHNRLRELFASGVETTCIIDGVAESGGSLIACACDKVIVNPSSLFMMHKCWTFIFGGYNSDELRSLATSLDATDKQQIAVYKRKSGKSDTVISHLMGATTFFVGQEIIDNGFADELTESDSSLSISASADKKFIFAGRHKIRVPKGLALPEFIKVNAPNDGNGEFIKSTKSADTDIKPKEEKIMATNFSELKAENPQLATAIEAEIRSAVSAENNEAVTSAVEAERQRLREIDEVAAQLDPAVVAEAKYEKPCSRADLAERALLASAKAGTSFIKNALTDSNESGVNDVGESPAPEDAPADNTKEDVAAAAKAAAENFKKIKGVK